MKKRITLITLTLILGLFSWSATAQVTVTGSVSGDGSYSTLGDAITAIPLSGQSGNNITIAISASTNELTTGITIGAGTWSSLKIYPTATATIQAVLPNTSITPFITLSGANNVTIDGRLDQTGASSLTLVNSSTANTTAGSTILFDNNAQNNTIKYCTIKGNQTGNFGIISFSATATLTNGNGLNTIDHNLITNNAGAPKYGIYAIGNTSFPNIGNQITNNEFKNLLAIYSVSTTVFIAGGASAAQNDNFTISGNSFYQTAIIDNFASNNFAKIMIGIGTSAAAYGGSHTITDNYIGGSEANCGGTALTKRYKEATFYAMLIYPSASVSGGGATSIQNNTIKNISWANDYFSSNWFAINIGGGTGAVNIGTITGNSIGDNTTNGSLILSNKLATAAATMINIATSGAVDCQNNKIGSITASNGTVNFVTGVNGIVKTTTAGATTISNNIIGSTTQSNSINATCTGTAAQAIYGINCTGTGINTLSNNTIANLTNNVSAVGNTYSISCTGTNSNTVSNNTIFNITNTTTTGNTYGINIGGAGSTGTANGNLIHSIGVGSTATTAIVLGIWGPAGTNTITNNIIKLGDNNSCEIRGLGDPSATTSTSIYYNTVYLTGVPTTLALSSACIFSSGSATIRNYKNNLLVNTRSNAGTATGKHYALNMTANASGTIAVDGNDYISSGTDGYLGRYNNVDKLVPQIVTDNDAASVSVDPEFTNAGGTTAMDYKPTMGIPGVTGTGVGFDFDGTARIKGTLGAYEISNLWTGLKTFEKGIRVFASFGEIKVIGAKTGDLIEVYNSLGQKVKTYSATQNDMSISLSAKGVYMIKVGSSANKVILQ